MRIIVGSDFALRPRDDGLVDPTLAKTRRMIVDVDDHHGIDYGASIAGDEPWPGTDAVTIDVQYDVDATRFMKLFIARLAQRH